MSINKNGIDSRRRILNPSSGFDQEISDLRRSSPQPSFFRAVVVEVLNVVNFSKDEISALKGKVINPEFADNVPRNSIIARIVSNARDRKNTSPIICYPFMPSHLSLPLKAGEHVWIMFENAAVSTRLGYYLWRITEPEHVDDVNYTHSDRKFDKSDNMTVSQKVAASSSKVTPSFPNGGGTSSSRTLYGEDDYETIVNESTSYESFTPEPVPKFSKRAGDTVLQGSNNSLIVLGEDRTAGPTKTETEKKTGSASVDIVVGRGRFLPVAGEEPTLTAPRVIENSRGYEENDKNPSASGNSLNSSEGDLDFINDSSRILVSMNTDGDSNFELDDNYPEPFESTIDSITNSPFVVVKSDEIRIVARKDTEHEINGSIRIVKEGEKGEDLAAILMLPDGTVQIDGKSIYIGRVGGSGPGASGSEPYIKFSEYKSQMEEFIGIVNSLMEVFTATFPLPDPPTVGGPSPSLVAALSNTGGVVTAIANLALLKEKIDNAASTRIFGE